MSLELILPSLIRDAKQWVRGERAKFRDNADLIPDEDRKQLCVHFDGFTLEHARIKKVSTIENPEPAIPNWQ